ncbi:hypothetical protein M3Y96_00386600 [Aphelenchoides besseyi]|nr:hypothetical protein M3Y96_00386600 [Aphelenchoides besseyi]
MTSNTESNATTLSVEVLARSDVHLPVGARRCSSNRSHANLDVVLVYDQTMPKNRLQELSALLKREFNDLTLHGNELQTSRFGIVGFDESSRTVLDLNQKIDNSQLTDYFNKLPSTYSKPVERPKFSDSLIRTKKMFKKNSSKRDLLVIVAISARSVDSDLAAVGMANDLRRINAHVISINWDDDNLLLESYLKSIADPGKAFSPYREPYFRESFSRAIDYANCRCRENGFEKQFSLYNYTSNHVDYFVNCIGAAFERKGNGIKEWCAALNAQPLSRTFISLEKNEKKFTRLFEFVESFVILNDFEVNSYDQWFVGESPRSRINNPRTRNSKRLALLEQNSALSLSRPNKWDFMTMNVSTYVPDVPFICQQSACDSKNPCIDPKLSTNYYEMLSKRTS